MVESLFSHRLSSNDNSRVRSVNWRSHDAFNPDRFLSVRRVAHENSANKQDELRQLEEVHAVFSASILTTWKSSDQKLDRIHRKPEIEHRPARFQPAHRMQCLERTITRSISTVGSYALKQWIAFKNLGYIRILIREQILISGALYLARTAFVVRSNNGTVFGCLAIAHEPCRPIRGLECFESLASISELETPIWKQG